MTLGIADLNLDSEDKNSQHVEILSWVVGRPRGWEALDFGPGGFSESQLSYLLYVTLGESLTDSEPVSSSVRRKW